jgi:hypothetical protein
LKIGALPEIGDASFTCIEDSVVDDIDPVEEVVAAGADVWDSVATAEVPFFRLDNLGVGDESGIVPRNLESLLGYPLLLLHVSKELRLQVNSDDLGNNECRVGGCCAAAAASGEVLGGAVEVELVAEVSD